MLTYIALQVAVMCNNPLNCSTVHPVTTEFCLLVSGKMGSERLI